MRSRPAACSRRSSRGSRAARSPGPTPSAASRRSWRRSSLELGPHVPEIGEEQRVDELLQVIDAGSAPRAALPADDPLDDLDVAEAPERELFVDVDQLLAHLVGVPVVGGFLV